MDTIRILNNFRISLTHDELLFKLLSKLYYKGPIQEEELLSNINSSSEQLRIRITKLFQAGLIEKLESSYLTVTPVAEDFLSRFGIPEIAAKSHIDEFNLPKKHKIFLKGCLELQSNTRTESARYYTSAIRSFFHSKSLLTKQIEPSFFNENISPIYVILVGLDPESKRVDPQKYCDEVFNWHRSKNTDWWNKEGIHIDKFKYEIVDNCLSAIKVTNNSELILRNLSERIANDINSKEKELDLSLFITLVRVLTSIIGNTVDPGLHSAYRLNSKLPDLIWDYFEKKSPGIEKKAERKLRLYLIKSSNTYDSSISKQLSGDLRKKLKNILDKDAQSEMFDLYISEMYKRRNLSPENKASNNLNYPSANKSETFGLLKKIKSFLSKFIQFFKSIVRI